LDGHGTYKFASGIAYTGDFKADHKEGQGTFKFTSGNVYTEDFKAGNKDGQDFDVFKQSLTDLATANATVAGSAEPGASGGRPGLNEKSLPLRAPGDADLATGFEEIASIRRSRMLDRIHEGGFAVVWLQRDRAI